MQVEDLKRSDKVSGIYKIENNINNKIYIGSSNNLYFRYTRHFKDLKQNKHHCIKLQRSFNKYGIDSFTFSIIEVTINMNDYLVQREQYYFDRLKPDLNSSKEAGRPSRNMESLKKRVNQYDLNGNFIKTFNSLNDASIQLGISRKLLNNKSAGGFQWRLNSSNTSNISPYVNLKYRPVYQCLPNGDIIRLWNSTRELDIHFGKECHQSISGVANGKRKLCMGYSWKFENT